MLSLGVFPLLGAPAGVREARLKGDVRPGAGFAAALPLRGVAPGRSLHFGNRGDSD